MNQQLHALDGGREDNRGLRFEDIKEYREVAIRILDEFYKRGGIPILRHWQGEFWRYRSGLWTAVEEVQKGKDEIFHEVHRLLSNSTRVNRNRDGSVSRVSVKPNTPLVNEIYCALSGLVRYHGTDMAWIFQDGPEDVYACLNGLVNIETNEIIENTPRFFNTRQLNANFNPDWMDDDDVWEEAWNNSKSAAFFAQLFEEDPDQTDLLQEIVGYILFGDNEQEKIFQIIGLKRSGKGSINNMLKFLLGSAACAPSTKSLEGDFALEGLNNMRMATLTDARIDRHTNFGALAETLLAISGGDPRDINRKGRTFLRGVHLMVRFFILSNSLAGFRDNDGVLADRMIYLKTSGSFFGREDPSVKKNLKLEADIWLAWAARGYLQLQARGHFKLTQTHRVLRSKSRAKMAPIKTFLDDFIEMDPNGYIPVDDLYYVFRNWIDAIGISKWEKSRMISSVHDMLEGATRKSRPVHEREMKDGSTNKRRERAVAGISWKEGKAPTQDQLAEYREFADEEDRDDD